VALAVERPVEPCLSDRFRAIAHAVSRAAGSVWGFAAAVLLVLAWAATGPLFHYSETWQLVINTATTVVTFVMVFLIQSSQNRDAQAMHLKLDELLRSVKGARTRLVNLEELTDAELERLQEELHRLGRAADHRGRSERRATTT
jgi:low affinity Fe/Cu permease